MSQKGKQRRAQREARQEQQANKVVKWIFGGLIALGVIYIIWTMVMTM